MHMHILIHWMLQTVVILYAIFMCIYWPNYVTLWMIIRHRVHSVGGSHRLSRYSGTRWGRGARGQGTRMGCWGVWIWWHGHWYHHRMRRRRRGSSRRVRYELAWGKTGNVDGPRVRLRG